MNNGFKGYHPIVNLTFFVSVVVFNLVFNHPAAISVCFIAALCYYIRLCNRAAIKSFFRFILPMLMFVVLFNGLLAHYGVTVLLTLPSGNKMTLEALVYGFVLGISTVTVIIWFFCYSEVVTADKFMSVFGKILPAAALVVSMALRFLPLYKRKFHEIADAQRGLGRDYKKGSFIERIRNLGSILSILVTCSLENAVETSDSMRARGYGLKGRKSYSKFKWKASDIVVFTVIVILDGVMALGGIMRSVYCVYNPYVIINPTSESGEGSFVDRLNLTVNPISAYGIITLSALAILCFLPLIIEIREELKWSRLKSKI